MMRKLCKDGEEDTYDDVVKWKPPDHERGMEIIGYKKRPDTRSIFQSQLFKIMFITPFVKVIDCFLVQTQEQNDSEGGGWSQVAEVGAGERKAKIEGLNTGDRYVLDEIMELLDEIGYGKILWEIFESIEKSKD